MHLRAQNPIYTDTVGHKVLNFMQKKKVFSIFLWEMDNHALGARSTTIRHSFSL